MNFHEIPASLDSEISGLEALIAKLKAGQISNAELKVHRVPFGVYEQRTSGTYMVRIRCTAGGITPHQLIQVAKLAKEFGNGVVHITTRQEIQLHNISLDHIVPVIRSLRQAGLSTRGGGGNTVRNITASADSGIALEETFDVTPYAVALTNRLAADPESWKLPRKYKIAFGNSEPDNIQARFNDLGLIARIENGRKGFRVTVAGGMGTKPQVGSVLHEFVPAQDVYRVALAIRNVFSAHGNRRNRHAARLRFLWNSLGEEQFRKYYNEELARVSAESSSEVVVSEWEHPSSAEASKFASSAPGEGLSIWRKRYVQNQKQQGLYSVLVPISLGILDSNKIEFFAEFLQGLGEDVLRFTIDQNILLRNIPEQALGHVFQKSRELTALTDQPSLFAHWISCAGADTCRLGVCRPREMVKATMTQLLSSGIDLDSLSGLVVNFSGCPNTCGQHMAADIGFYGKISRAGEDMLPAYAIVAGAIRGGNRARLAQPAGDVPARAVPGYLKDLLRTFSQGGSTSVTFREWIEEGGTGELQKICERHKAIPSFDEDKNFYFDWGSKEVFSLKGKGAGECSAGLFDLIELDLESARKSRKALLEQNGLGEHSHEIRRQMVLSASRALLITKGLDAKTEAEVFGAFLEHFVAAGLIPMRFTPVVEAARDRNNAKLPELSGLANELVDAVDQLYKSMDDSLRFPAGSGPGTPATSVPQPKNAGQAKKADLERDLRGVACPMNFVKTKLELAKLQSGQVLRVLLDDGAPVENVPRSVEGEGHRIVEITREQLHWAVVIQKGQGA